VTTRLPLMWGQINDGIEPEYLGTDVPRLATYVQGLSGCELDRRLADQLPDWDTFQGPADDPDASTLGIALRPGLMTVQDVFWVPLTTRHRVLIVRADYQGGPLSLFTTKRPSRAHADLWPAYDSALGKVLRGERVVAGGHDANEPDSPALQTATRMTWTAPHDTSIVGTLTSSNVGVLACTQLPATGEHAPVLTWLRVPTL
jgi:hypothetical protein